MTDVRDALGPDHDRFRHDDAAYVLGALGREDRIAFETHLHACPQCAASVAELAVLPGLLGRLPAPPDPAAPPGELPGTVLPETVLPGILAAVRRERSRRRLWTTAAGLAASAVLVGGTVAVTDRLGPDTTASPPARGEAVALAAVVPAPVEADLHMQEVAWGTRLTMTCRYDGVPTSDPYGPGTEATYQLVVVSAGDDAPRTVASWRVLPGRDALVTGSTDLVPAQIAEVQLRTGDGTVLLAGAPPR